MKLPRLGDSPSMFLLFGRISFLHYSLLKCMYDTQFGLLLIHYRTSYYKSLYDYILCLS